MGWRSWSWYGPNISQDVMERIMDGMVRRTAARTDHLGNVVSFCDLGYCDIGLDDNWQACDDAQASPGMHYHDVHGKPLVNTTSFPDLKLMTSYAHSLNLTVGWYGNNCICRDQCRNVSECTKQIRGDVEALFKYDFDSWKLDACGGQTDLVKFNKYMRKIGKHKPILVENCHWGSVVPFKPDRSLPPSQGCPWNFYRSSGDVLASYASVLFNLATVEPYRRQNLSYPGCWAYPDMLQVGIKHGVHKEADEGLNPAETRSHFGSWAIVSSPLILSFDVNDDDLVDSVWDIVSNREIIAVNQAYSGDSGGLYDSSTNMVELNHLIETRSGKYVTGVITVPSYQYFSKPLGGGRVAVLLMNSATAMENLTANFSDIPGLKCTKEWCWYHVRDIWKHQDIGVFEGCWTVSIGSHDAAFVLLEALAQNPGGIIRNADNMIAGE